MKTFRPGMDVFREVLTASNLNELAASSRDIAWLRDRLGPGAFGAAAQAVRCVAAAAVAPGDAVVPTGIAAGAASLLTASGALSRPVSVRAATAADAAAAVWGVAIEGVGDDGGEFRAAFHGIAAVRVPRGGSGDFLAPDAAGALAFASAATRCRVLCTAAGPDDEGGGGDEAGGEAAEPFDWALVAFADAAPAPCPQWRISATPPAEEGGDWTVSVEGGSVVVADISLDAAGGGAPAPDAGGHHAGGGGPPGDTVHVPTITYGA